MIKKQHGLFVLAFYVAAAFMGRTLVDATGFDPYTVGWAFGGVAVLLRMSCPGIRDEPSRFTRPSA